jgi:hypothetical protein
MDEILKWVDVAPRPADLEGEGETMRVVCDAMGRALYLLRASVSVVPNDLIAARGVSRHRAVFIGHMARLCKLFDAFYMHVAKQQLEIAGVLSRLIFETEIRLSYLIEKGTRKSISTFILSSYRAEKECLIDLRAKAKKRRLTPIEKRIRMKIRHALRADGFSEAKLLANKIWSMDGKSARDMLKELGREWQYGYGFGMESRWVHGSWLELKNCQLAQQGRFYMPEPSWTGVDVRAAVPLTYHCLDLAGRYLTWSKGDPNREIRNAIRALAGWLIELDAEHERRLSFAKGI